MLVGTVDHLFHDVATLPVGERARVLDPDSYGVSRALAHRLRDAGSDGITYPSVRDLGGTCVAAFWPDAVGIPRQERHLQYEWDGRRVSRYFDYGSDQWVNL